MSEFFEQKKALIKKLFDNNTISISSAKVVSIADSKNKASKAISLALIDVIDKEYGLHPNIRKKLEGQTAGNQFEKAIEEYLSETFLELKHLRPGDWAVKQLSKSKKTVRIADYSQYEHLEYLNILAKKSPELKSVLGNDYLVAPDIVLYLAPYSDDEINAEKELVDKQVATHTIVRKYNSEKKILHGSISVKLTMRSDRAQNSRTEALNLIRNRNGRLPHIVVVTAEPTGSRLASLAQGTGDIDCVYHIALPELVKAADTAGADETLDTLKILIDGKRLKDITDLPLDLIL